MARPAFQPHGTPDDSDPWLGGRFGPPGSTDLSATWPVPRFGPLGPYDDSGTSDRTTIRIATWLRRWRHAWLAERRQRPVTPHLPGSGGVSATSSARRFGPLGTHDDSDGHMDLAMEECLAGWATVAGGDPALAWLVRRKALCKGFLVRAAIRTPWGGERFGPTGTHGESGPMVRAEWSGPHGLARRGAGTPARPSIRAPWSARAGAGHGSSDVPLPSRCGASSSEVQPAHAVDAHFRHGPCLVPRLKRC